MRHIRVKYWILAACFIVRQIFIIKSWYTWCIKIFIGILCSTYDVFLMWSCVCLSIHHPNLLWEIQFHFGSDATNRKNWTKWCKSNKLDCIQEVPSLNLSISGWILRQYLEISYDYLLLHPLSTYHLWSSFHSI